MAEPQLLSVTPELVAGALQAAGLRAEHFDDPSGRHNILSGSVEVPFRVRLGNPAAPPAEGYLDFTFIMLIKLPTEFPLEHVNTWNQQRRFSRLHRQDDVLVLDLDVIVAGGVGADYVSNHVALWAQIVQEMMTYLRDHAPDGAANAA